VKPVIIHSQARAELEEAIAFNTRQGWGWICKPQSSEPLADLINMKLRSGATNLLRAQDLADVIGLIRHHQLSSGFARHLDKALRPAFRKLVRLIQRENSGR
jgi:hypothetical protein